MSEPNAGSDLASVKTRATRNGQGWTLNGQKIWTTNAHHCHYMIALVRTSGTAEDPSYMEAFATSIPVNWQTIV